MNTIFSREILQISMQAHYRKKTVENMKMSISGLPFLTWAAPFAVCGWQGRPAGNLRDVANWPLVWEFALVA